MAALVAKTPKEKTRLHRLEKVSSLQKEAKTDTHNIKTNTSNTNATSLVQCLSAVHLFWLIHQRSYEIFNLAYQYDGSIAIGAHRL